eukprot:2441316-Pyramimonas_sp.AAC.1
MITEVSQGAGSCRILRGQWLTRVWVQGPAGPGRIPQSPTGPHLDCPCQQIPEPSCQRAAPKAAWGGIRD